MEKAVNMITTEKGSEPIMISKIHDNVLTEPTEETTVAFEIKSYYIDEESGEEIEVPAQTRGGTAYAGPADEKQEINDKVLGY